MSSRKEYTMLLADIRNDQQGFFKQVLEHQESLRGQLLALHSSQEDLISEFRKFTDDTSSKNRLQTDDGLRLTTQSTTKSVKIFDSEKVAIASIPGRGSDSYNYESIDSGAYELSAGGDVNGSSWQPTDSDSKRNSDRRSAVGRQSKASMLIEKQLSGKHRGLFGDMTVDKSQLDQEEYNVAQFYYETGVAQGIAKSDWFANLTLLVIFLNTIYIGYDADNNKEENLLDADLQFIIMENLFCLFFFFEWIIRFFAFQNKCNCLKDLWFKFDTILAALMVLETWILPPALSGGTGIPSGLVKMVRLLRLARMARIMRAFPDLVAMIKGVRVASRAVGSALLMLVGLVYIFAIIMFTILRDVPNPLISDRFRRLGLTMWSLLVDGTFLDGFGTVSRALLDENQYVAVAVLLLFVLGSALTVMNMLIGVLCEVVSAVASAEKEESAVRMVKEKLLVLLRELDEDGSGKISKVEIDAVLHHDDAMEVLHNLNVDVSHLLDHLDMYFDQTEGGELTIQQIMDLILMLRGDRRPTMNDMLLGQAFSRWKASREFEDVRTCMSSMTIMGR